MQIYIVRHAIAEDIGKGGGSDARRALTAEGRKKMKDAAEGFARLEPHIERIFSSPLVRAVQTAEIVAKAIKFEKEIEEMKELSPGYGPDDVLKRLREFRGVKSVALAGHEPNCSELASHLLSNSDRVLIEFKKGAICYVESDALTPGSGMLVWHLSPQTLRLMAG
jgi:phosphohistidine phosphatase